MRRTRILAAVATLAGLAAVAAASGVVYLLLELDRANDSLLTTQTALDDTTTTLVETRVALANTQMDLAAQEGVSDGLRQEVTGLQRDNASLGVDKDALLGYLNDALLENGALTDELEAAEVDKGDLRGRLAAEVIRVTALTRANADLEGRLGDVTLRFETRDAEYTTLDAEHRRLVQAAGEAEELETRAGELREEIVGLEQRRRPLLLAAQRQRVEGFLCTGSMEPKITCLDTATWMRDFSPEEVVVGSVISYPNRACLGDDTPGRTAHRVLAIQIIEGVHYYWPKGDALAEPDGCWVPYTAVDGYIVELHRDTVPANAMLRDEVNAARAAYDTAWEVYLDAIEATCGHRDHRRCSYSLTTALGRQAQDLWLQAKAASDFYSCWLGNAAASQRPGHIPFEC